MLFIIQQNPYTLQSIYPTKASECSRAIFLFSVKISCKYEINSYNLKRSESESKYSN